MLTHRRQTVGVWANARSERVGPEQPDGSARTCSQLGRWLAHVGRHFLRLWRIGGWHTGCLTQPSNAFRHDAIDLWHVVQLLVGDAAIDARPHHWHDEEEDQARGHT